MESIKITKVDRVVLVKAGVHQEGTLHLTAHHIIFHKNEEQETWIPYPLISLVTRLPQAHDGASPISVRCRTFENITLYFRNSQDALDVFDSIKESTVATSVTKLYAFYYQPPTDTPRKGWAAFTPREEFARMGVGSRTKAWRFTDFNKDYRVCPTYPAILVVPARISDATLKYAAEYRSKARIPSLSYLHWGNFATITRCSQPMVGLTGNRSVQDEKLIEAIFQSHHSAHSVYAAPPDGRTRSTSSPVYGSTTVNLIIDARPMTNAMANAAKGAGTENMDNYKEAKKVYLGIDNIHVMRDSLAKVTEALYEADMLAGMSASNSESPDTSEPGIPKTFLDRQLLRRSGWLRHLSAILEGTMIIVDNVHVKASHSLLHCSDGWDRTAQLSSLAQICLDPFFRTIRGFYVIVEKEWLSYGHKFLDRCGHLSSEKLFVTAPSDGGGSSSDAAQAFFASVQNKFSGQSHLKETSPVFHQFLESLWQILRQFPTRFEYNEEFLLKVHYHLNSCQFGTFLFNCERERRVSDGDQPTAEQRTHSVWDWFDTQRSSWLNPDFDPESNNSTNRDMGVLMPDPKDVRFWYRLYGRGDEDMNGGGIANQATAAGVELRGPISGSDDDPVLQFAGSPLLALTPSSTPPPSVDPDSSKAAPRLPYQAWSPARPKRTTPGPPSSSSSPAPGIARQDSFRPFGSTTSAFPLQPGANEINAPVSSRPWGNTGGFAGGAGGMKSVWASLSSNASAVFQAAQQAYDNTTREYSSPSAESSSTRRNDLLSTGGELPTVSRPGSLGRRAGSTSLARGPLAPVELGNPWSDEPPVVSSSATQPNVVSPTPVEAPRSKSTIDLGTQPWAQPSISSPQPRTAQPPSLPDSIGSLPSLSDLTLLTESSMSRSRSSAAPSPKPPPPTTDTAPTTGSVDNRQPQSVTSDIDPLGVGFK